MDLLVSVEYLAMLGRDPLFVETLAAMEGEVHSLWVGNRVRAMDILEDHASTAAKLCTDAVSGSVVDANGAIEKVPLNKRLDSAWDVLNRTGNKAVEKRLEIHATLQEMIIQAYQQRSQSSPPVPVEEKALVISGEVV